MPTQVILSLITRLMIASLAGTIYVCTGIPATHPTYPEIVLNVLARLGAHFLIERRTYFSSPN